MSNGMKYDGEKPQLNLMPPLAELETGRVLTFGAKKYAPDNWRKVDDAENRYIAAAMRHINAIRQGETRDQESGLLHAAHATCCLMFIAELQIENDSSMEDIV